MQMFDYSIFEKLCKERGVNASKVSSATGIATSTFSAWKKGDYTPKPPKMKKIADYFGVSLAYMNTGKNPITQANIDIEVDGDDLTYIVSTVRKWSPEQQKRLRKYVEEVNRIVGGTE